MTIDEAITREKNRSDSMVKHAEIFCVTQEFLADIEYHGQLAEWLEELKEARKGFNENRKAGYKHGYSDGYNKAINDLVFQSQKVRARGLITNWGKPFGIEFDKLDEIAQQLKEGGTNGNPTTDN